MWVDLKAGSFVQGGSTITQQLVKNLYLSNEKTISRKIKEFIIALYIERLFSKEEILESYFNEFIWGALQGTKIKGISSAAVFYFGKKASVLKPYEVAILIAMLKGPYFYHPIRRPKRLKQRVDFIFEKLKKLSLFPVDEEQWSDLNWEKWRSRLVRLKSTGPYKSLERASLMESVTVNGLQDFERYIFFKKAQALRSQLLKKLKFKKDITVKAIIGNPLSIKGKSPFYYYSKRERSLKRSIESERHQVGSVLKPLIYRVFLVSGRSLEEMVSLEKIILDLKSGLWAPREANKKLPKKVSLREAMVKSFNRPVVRIASEVGFNNIEKN